LIITDYKKIETHLYLFIIWSVARRRLIEA